MVKLASANSSYTVDTTNPGQFVIGEGVIVAADDSAVGGTDSGTQSANAAFGIVSHQTYTLGNTSKNVATVTVKTSANAAGILLMDL